MKSALAIISTVLFLVLGGFYIVLSVQLDQNCTGYLKRAADANKVETAQKELEKAITYLEANNLTDGYTSVLWRTPNEDIGFWYNNIKESYDELSKVDENTTPLERSNLLMKLRETLLDNGEKGTTLTYPRGISRYPNNGLMGTLLWVFGLTAFFTWGYKLLDY